MRMWMIAMAVVGLGVLAVPGARAHEGHAHKVMGTVSSVDGNNLMVKTTDGKSVMVMMDAKTKVMQGKTTVKSSTLKVGDRIVAEGTEQKQMIMATSVKVGTAK